MCGICGIITRQPIQAEAINTLKKVNQALFHRGPDGEGFFQDEHIFLAMRRLSIIDLDGGWQPIYNEDHSLVVVCNGEILNYIELRHMLKAQGHVFSTDGDVETIVHLYETYGMEFVQYLRGQFAFALYDKRQQKVILGRDRIGEKPIVMYQDEHRLVFASEIKALLQDPQIPFELDPQAIDWYLHYTSIPDPYTPLKSIRKLPHGHVLTINIANWHINTHAYWHITPTDTTGKTTLADIQAELDTAMEMIVRADVPVGIALSGGLDSSAIAVMTHQKYPHTMQAFSVGYAESSHTDERQYAQDLAKQLGMPFHNIELSTDEMVKDFAHLVHRRDDLIADIAGYGYDSLAKCASEHGIRVLLLGQGGDELFWGYEWLRHATQDNLIAQKNLSWAKAWAYIASDMPANLSVGMWRKWLSQIRHGKHVGIRRLQLIRNKRPNRLIYWDINHDWHYNQHTTRNLYSPSFATQLADDNAYLPFSISEPLQDIPLAMTRLIMQTYLMSVGIAQGDRLSMAHHVEVRLPLVDYKLIETVLNYRHTHPDDYHGHKETFKKVLANVLPSDVLNRTKRGFEPPVKTWYRALKRTYGSHLLEGYLVQQRLFRADTLQRLLESNAFPDLEMTFKLLCLEMWCRSMRQEIV
jgi:asparagine synthase (glutamine-hydrolysing)